MNGNVSKYAIPNVTHAMIRVSGIRLRTLAKAHEMAHLRNDEKMKAEHDRAMMIEIDLMLKGISIGAGHALRKARY